MKFRHTTLLNSSYCNYKPNDDLSILHIHYWTYWDDSYTFISNNNGDLAKSNLTFETFSNLNLNLIYYFENSEQMIFGNTFCIEDDYLHGSQDLALTKLLVYESLFLSSTEVKTTRGLL
jgi:hypothetical protein